MHQSFNLPQSMVLSMCSRPLMASFLSWSTCSLSLRDALYHCPRLFIGFCETVCSVDHLIASVEVLVWLLTINDGDASGLAWLDLPPSQVSIRLKLSQQMYSTSLGRGERCEVAHVSGKSQPQARPYQLSSNHRLRYPIDHQMVQSAMTPTSRCFHAVV